MLPCARVALAGVLTRVSHHRCYARILSESLTTIVDGTTQSTTGPAQPDNMQLGEVVSVLKKLASPSLAGSWDNVGLLIEPSPPHTVSKVLLTNDLSPAVMQEAVDRDANLIVSYHPPIFAPLKRLTQSSWKEKIAGMCLEKRIALYSPHTSWDAVAGGVNDWLIGAFDVEKVKPIEQTEQYQNGVTKKLTFRTTPTDAQTINRLPMMQQPEVTVLVEQV